MVEREAKSLIDKKLSLPAYDQCLKASHIFNLLDARGAISVAQRAEYISKIRELTKLIGKIWVESPNLNGRIISRVIHRRNSCKFAN